MNKSRFFLILIVSLLVVSMVGGCVKDNSKTQSDSTTQNMPSSTTESPETSTVDVALTGGHVMPLTKEKITYEWMINEHPTFPVDLEKWEFFKKIEEITNVDIEFIIVPSASYSDRCTIYLASGKIPDIMAYSYSNWHNVKPDNIILEVGKYFNEVNTPNILRFLKTYPEIEPQIKSVEGKFYYFPHFEDGAPAYCWLVRDDILKKENLEVPVTMNDFIELCRTLKQRYPNSTPISVRSGGDGNILDIFDDAYDTYANDEIIIAIIDGKAQFTLEDPKVYEMVKVVHTLYSEGLLDSDYPLVKANIWEERILTGKAFLTYDWNTRAEYFNNANATAPDEYRIEGFNLVRMLSPIPEGGSGSVPGRNTVSGRMTLLSDKIKNPEIAIRFLDFFYSPLGYELTEFGIEGKTFVRLPDGGRMFTNAVIHEDNPDISNALDRKVFGLNYNWISHNVGLGANPNDRKHGNWDAWTAKLRELGRIFPDQMNLPATEEERSIWAEKYSAIQKHFAENIDSFVMGKRPLSEWSNFINEMKRLGVDELVKMKQAQYDRVAK